MGDMVRCNEIGRLMVSAREANWIEPPKRTAALGAPGAGHSMVTVGAETPTHQNTLVIFGVAGVFLHSLETIDGRLVLVAQFLHERAENLDLLAGYYAPKGPLGFLGKAYPQIYIVIVNEQVLLLAWSHRSPCCSATNG